MTLTLKQLSGNTYYIPGPVNIGVVINADVCLVIDTGLDKKSGKQILRCLRRPVCRLKQLSIPIPMLTIAAAIIRCVRLVPSSALHSWKKH